MQAFSHVTVTPWQLRTHKPSQKNKWQLRYRTAELTITGQTPHTTVTVRQQERVVDWNWISVTGHTQVLVSILLLVSVSSCLVARAPISIRRHVTPCSLPRPNPKYFLLGHV
jgi:hypothetical protein